MRRIFPLLFGPGSIGLLLSKAAYACPFCHSSTADEVRAGIQATAQDGSVILALVGPFVALGIVLSLLNRFMPSERERNGARNERK